MGLFSSSYKTTVATSISRAITDKMIPSAVSAGVITALLSGEDLVEHALENLAGSIGVKAERLFAYGAKDYPYGLPSGRMRSPLEGRTIVKGVIELEMQATVVEDYYHFGALNLLHLGWLKLQQDYGYDSLTNQLGVLSASLGTPAYLHDMVAVVTEASQEEMGNGSLAVWGVGANAGLTPYRSAAPGLRKPSSYQVDTLLSADCVRVTYAHQGTTGMVYSTVDISLIGYAVTKDHFQVGYTLPNGRRGYWLYQSGAAGYPGVDAIFGTNTSPLGSFYPWGYLRFNKQSQKNTPQSVEAKASKKFFKLLGIDYTTMVENIDGNPGAADIEQAILMMAVPANTTNQLELRYLFDFFREAYFEAGGVTPDSVGSVASLAIADTYNTQTGGGSFFIQDKRFNLVLSFQSMGRTRKAGNLGAVGTFAMAYTPRSITEEFETVNGEGDPIKSSRTYTINEHFYRKQVSDTLYEEIRVSGLQSSYYVQGDYRVPVAGTDNRLLIPVDKSVSSVYSVPDKETLYSRSLHYVINSLVVTEVQWYQQSWFADLLMIAAIVMTVVSLGTTSPQLVALAATLGVSYVVMVAIVLIVQTFIIKPLFALFVKAIGPELAIVLAIAAAMVGAYDVIQAGGLQGAPFAESYLSLSNGLSEGVSTVYNDLMSGITSEYGKLTELYESKSKLLEEAQDLLGSKNNLLSPFVIFGESPTDYYQRSVHSGNIGVQGINAVSSFVDIALTLPKLSETTGD